MRKEWSQGNDLLVRLIELGTVQVGMMICRSTCEEILKVVKKLDVLVLNAGINAHSKF